MMGTLVHVQLYTFSYRKPVIRPQNMPKTADWGLGGFSIIWVPKLLLSPLKIRMFGPKTAKFGPKYAFLVIFGQILPIFAHFVQCPTINKFEQNAWVGFPLYG